MKYTYYLLIFILYILFTNIINLQEVLKSEENEIDYDKEEEEDIVSYFEEIAIERYKVSHRRIKCNNINIIYIY